MDSNKHLSCDDCVHKEVCSYRQLYTDTQNAVNNVVVTSGSQNTWTLKDLTWIRPIFLQCEYYEFKRSSNIRCN